jgi:CBS domain-containing protein
MIEHAEVEIVREFDPVMLPMTSTVMMAARHMRNRNVSAVLVTEGMDPASTTLAEVMTDNPDTVTPRDSAQHVVHLMHAGQCRHLPIVEEGKVVGMVSRGPFLEIDN